MTVVLVHTGSGSVLFKKEALRRRRRRKRRRRTRRRRKRKRRRGTSFRNEGGGDFLSSFPASVQAS